MDALEGVIRLVAQILGWVFGWPIYLFKRWLDRQPDRDPTQISTLHKIGRLGLGIALTLAVLVPMGWLVFR